MSVVDARGLRCPLPVLRLARTARELPAGSEITLLATDPAAAPDVRAWARLRGHAVVSVAEDVVGDGAADRTTGDRTTGDADGAGDGPTGAASGCWRIVVRLSG